MLKIVLITLLILGAPVCIFSLLEKCEEFNFSLNGEFRQHLLASQFHSGSYLKHPNKRGLKQIYYSPLWAEHKEEIQ